MSTNDQMPSFEDPFANGQEANQSPNPAASDDSPTSNVYSASHQQRHAPELDAGAPELNDPRGRGVNKKMIFMMSLAGGLALLFMMLLINQFFGSKKVEQPREEHVTIPEAPAMVPVPPPVVVTTPVSAPVAEPIEVKPSQPATKQQVSEVVIQSAPQPKPDPMLERRRQQSPLVDGGAPESTNVEGGAVEKGSAFLMKNRDYMLVRGTYIRCVLETRIVTDVPGFTSCITTEPVYSVNGKKLLLPQGSKISGQFGTMNPTGPRIGVIWDRLLTPTGYDVRLRSPGVDQQGGSGHEGDYRSHWMSRMGAAILTSMISDGFKYAAAEYGPQGTTTTNNSTTNTPYESNTAQTIQDIARDQARRLGGRPATVTINQGTIINIYAARDIDFSGVIKN